MEWRDSLGLPSARWSLAALAVAFGLGLALATWVLPQPSPQWWTPGGWVGHHPPAVQARRATGPTAGPQPSSFSQAQGPPAGGAATVAVASSPDPNVAPGLAEGAAVALERVAVYRTLDGFRNASGALDVDALAQVWPTANRRALTRAFAMLRSQHVSFDSCDLDVASGTAIARCRGVVQFVRKEARPRPRSVSRHWMVTMRKVDAGWQIVDVVMRSVHR